MPTQKAHVACVNWIPEIYFTGPRKYLRVRLPDLNSISEDVQMKNYNKERKEIFCGLCKVKYGDCIQVTSSHFV